MSQERRTKFTYYVINIKLLSKKRSGSKAYIKIFEDLFANTIHKPTHRGKSVILRTLFPSEAENGKFYHGKISRFTDFDNPDWINLETKEVQSLEIPKGLFPNLQETDFVFVPKAHRVLILLSPNFTLSNALDFFNKAIPDVLDFDEDIIVTAEQSESVFEEIFKAIRVERLDIQISYTNADINKDAMAYMDDELKDSNLKSAFMRFDAEKSEGINVNTTLIKGSLGLAQENGFAEARIINSDNRRTTIKTKQHPKKVPSSAENDSSIFRTIFREVMQKYRNE